MQFYELNPPTPSPFFLLSKISRQYSYSYPYPYPSQTPKKSQIIPPSYLVLIKTHTKKMSFNSFRPGFLPIYEPRFPNNLFRLGWHGTEYIHFLNLIFIFLFNNLTALPSGH